MARKTKRPNVELAPPESLLEAVTYFADPDRALAFMVELRWPSGVKPSITATPGWSVLPAAAVI